MDSFDNLQGNVDKYNNRDIWSIKHNTNEYLHAYLIHLITAKLFFVNDKSSK